MIADRLDDLDVARGELIGKRSNRPAADALRQSQLFVDDKDLELLKLDRSFEHGVTLIDRERRVLFPSWAPAHRFFQNKQQDDESWLTL